jgi:DNA-directed RNA polymerase subunit K/omega
LEVVGNPNVLVNLVSKRVRQLTSGGATGGRPLVAESTGLGVADIALLEIIEGKMAWTMPEEDSGEQLLEEKSGRRRKRL